MATFVKDIQFETGNLIVSMDSGAPKRVPVTSFLPALTYSEVAAIKTLANLVVVLVRTLIDKGILNESFMEDDDFDLDALIYSIERIGGSYHEPDLSVPNTG